MKEKNVATAGRKWNLPRQAPVLLLLLLLLGGGALLVWQTVRQADVEMRADLLEKARAIAAGVNIDRLRSLSGTEKDLQNPLYLQLKDQLAAVHLANPDYRFLYFLGRKDDGSIFFYVDNEASDSKDYSPPGQVYSEASENMHSVFSTHNDFAEGPYADRWGTWVTALIPIFDPQTVEHGLATGVEAQAMVRRAVDFYRKNGRERFLKELNDPQGEFHKGDLYAFVYDRNMTILAHPVKPELVGQNLLEKKDWSGGKYFSKEIQEVALSKGSGWVDYEYENPVNKQRAPKTTYVEKAGDLIVCAGVYKGNGSLLTVMGIDIDAHVWNWRLVRAAIPPVLLTLALAVLLLLGSALFARRSQIEGKPPRWMMNLESILAVAVGLALTLFTAWMFQHNEIRSRNNYFLKLAINQTENVAEEMNHLSDFQLEGLEYFYKGSENVEANEFLKYTQYLLRKTSVRAWEWIPVVKAADKGTFEAAARAEGMTGFGIWEKNARGERIPVADRPEYYPVYRVAPLAENEKAVGYDLGSETQRRAAIEEATKTGVASVTDPVDLVQLKKEGKDQKGMLFLQPVFKDEGPNRLKGFVGAVLQMKSFMSGVVSSNALPMELFLLRKDAKPVWLASTEVAGRLKASGISMARPVFVFGKVFAVTAYMGTEYERLYPVSSGWVVLFAGGSLTGVIAMVIALILRRREKLEELIVERTRELRRSEESYRNQFVKNSTVMLLLDPESGAILDANEAALAFYGYPRERLLAMRVTDINTAPASEVERAIDSVMRDEGKRFQFRHRLADGTVRDVEIATTRIQFGGRSVLHSIIHDNTERRLAEAALEESEKRFLDVLYASEDAILLIEGNKFVDANESTAHMLGYETREKFLKTHPSELSPPTQPDGRSSFEKADEMMRLAIEQGFHQFEWMHRKANGEDFPVQVSLTPVTLKAKRILYCVWKDLTQKKLNEQRIAEAHRDLQKKTLELQASLEESARGREVLVSMMDDNNEMRARFEQNAKKLELILSSVGEGILGLDGEGKHTFLNPQALKMLGYEAEELIGKPSHSLWHHSRSDGSPLPATECPNYMSLRDGQSRQGEEYYWRKDGSGFPVQFSVVPIMAEGKTGGLVVSFFDITERKRVEQALRQGEERLRSITDSAQDAILMMDPRGAISFWNPAAEKILGYSNQEAIGMNLHQLLAPGRFHTAHAAAYPEFLRTGKGAAVGKTLELAAIRKDGVEIAVSLSLSSVKRDDGWHAVGLMSDITERKRSEMELRKLHQAMEQSPATVVITDLTGAIEYVNPKFSESTGYTREEALGQNPRILKSGELSNLVYKELWEMITAGKEWHGEFHNKKKNGELYWESASISAIRNADGKITNFLAVKEDITKQKESEELMRTMMGELNKARVNAEIATQAKAMFLANMSHEIRTPMNAIIGFSDLLRQTALDQEQRNFVNAMHSSGQALLELVNDILDFSKIEAGKVALEEIDFNLEYLCRDAFNIVSARIKNATVSTYVDFQDNVPLYLRGDPTRLRQILINLIGNAAKFTERGEIGLIISLSEEIPSSGETVIQFSVKDSGIGISPKKQHLLFQTFTQVDMSTTRKYGGTGLGLAICKTLVEKMHGDIWIESKENVGSEFKFTVKLKKGMSPLEENIMPLGKKSLAGKSVLIVDDIRIAQEITKKYCLDIGLSVAAVASSAEEGLNYMKQAAAAGRLPDIVLSDVRMEKMDGYQFVESLNALFPQAGIKCIAITSDVWTGAAKESEKRGFQGYLPKPILKGDLARVIGAVLGDERDEKQIITKHTANEIACKGMRVLVVEDTKTNQMLIKAVLTKWGCVIEFADNGQEGLEKLRTNVYDICLMDLQMPVMGGLEATQIFRREISKDFPVIALTEAVLDEDRLKCAEAGMTDFISKPINVDILKEKLIKYGRPV